MSHGSVWDDVPVMERPFVWSTSATADWWEADEPMRVTHAQSAQSWLRHLFPEVRDLFTEGSHTTDRIWVSVRGHDIERGARLQEVLDVVRAMKLPTRPKYGPSGRLDGFFLEDDVKARRMAHRVAARWLRTSSRYFFEDREVSIVEFLQHYEKKLRQYMKKNKDDLGYLYDYWFTMYRRVMQQVNGDLPVGLRRKINQHNRQIGGLSGDVGADIVRMADGLRMLVDGLSG